MAVPLLVWVSQSLTTKLGVSVGVEFASQLSSFIQRDDDSLIVYEQQLKEQAITALTSAKNEIKDVLHSRDLDQKKKRSIYLLSRQLISLSNKIRYSGTSENLKDENKNNISYLNVMLLSYTHSILSKIKNINDTTEYETNDNVDYSEIKNIIREAEQILEIKSLLINVDNKNILKYLSDNNPELFVKLRSLAGIMHRMDEMKKPRFTPSHKYHEKIQGFLLYMLDEIIDNRGPIVSFSELYSDFIKEYPNVEINQLDLEKAIQELCKTGMIDNFTEVDEGFKIIKIKPLKFSDTYHKAITFVSNNQLFLENGVSKEELATNMDFSVSLSEQLLDELATDDIAWKHGVKYYFPGLAESAYRLKTTVVG